MLAAAPVLGGAPGVDPSIRPADDFYGYANHAWLESVTLPDGASSIDTSSMLRAANAQRVRDLIADAVVLAQAPPVSPDTRKIGDYYLSRLDLAGIDAKGLSPLSGDLAAIAAIGDRKALAAWLGRTLRLDDGTNQQTESLWGVWIHQGFHDPDHYAAHFVQGGLGLAQDDYLGSTADTAAHRALYRAHVANLLRLSGLDQPEIRAARVLDLEIAIARTHASRADTDDVFKTDNDWRAADFAARAPGIDWAAYFAAAGLDPATRFVVWQPQGVIGGASLVATQPLDAWKDYLSFHLIDHYAAVLPQAVRDERRAFDAHLAGAPMPPAPDPQPQALAATQAAFGDAIGRLYVDHYFPPRAKAAAEDMVANIRTAFRARIAGLTWMAPETKAKALAKLAALRVGLGYPESWVDYSQLAVVRGDAFGNLQRAETFAYHRETAKLSRRVDPDEWAGGLYPQAVGAVLNISPNTMDFAAGLLQPPYFDPAGDAASNYGSAGAGIAHEISHSFDEVANLYDAQGRLGLWWSKDDLAHYQAATAPLAAQLDTCCPGPDACAHGKQIVGESSADLAGLLVAHDAYLLSLHGKRDVVKNGLTGEQRFFIAFAQRWRRLQTDAALQRQIATDTHAPPVCRADLVRNVEAWARVFGVRPGDKLYLKPEARFRVW
ncbi:MAG TPA: M13 family metallopeptidase [Sphingomonas sp.]|uniref:M13 family metallopeptidase n=1 Tax=Sphingomonas sp. TaxID=28214 RepID=UPI002BB97324|nr:M13 family metallopeptidase [Sphingomonas sp.]HMI18152.1 M13 family metallopeptidase [Sphingomonas sp.]